MDIMPALTSQPCDGLDTIVATVGDTTIRSIVVWIEGGSSPGGHWQAPVIGSIGTPDGTKQ